MKQLSQSDTLTLNASLLLNSMISFAKNLECTWHNSGFRFEAISDSCLKIRRLLYQSIAPLRIKPVSCLSSIFFFSHDCRVAKSIVWINSYDEMFIAFEAVKASFNCNFSINWMLLALALYLMKPTRPVMNQFVSNRPYPLHHIDMKMLWTSSNTPQC